VKLSELLSNRFAVPSRPRAVAQLMVELARPDVDLQRVNQFVNADPALTLRLLQAANASYFKLSGQVHGVSEALAILRLGQVQSMVASMTTTAVQAGPGLNLADYWSCSLDCAKVARALARLLQLNAQAAFTCGLIHAVGELAMRASMAQAVELDEMVMPLDFRRWRVERRAFDFCFSEVSAWLVRQWHLPPLIYEALLHAHAPFEGDAEGAEPLAGVVHLAIWRARCRHMGLTGNVMTVTFPSEVAEVLGLDIDAVLRQDPIDWSMQQPGQSLL